MKVLVVAAHPDDEILGVGGTVAAHVDRGDEVTLAVMCEGVSIRYDAERHDEVVRQAHQAASILGVTDLVLKNLPDQRLDTIPLGEVIGEVEELVRGRRPETVYTHFGGDINRDHQIIAEAVLVATRPYAAPSVREILMFETPSSTEWGSSQLLPAFDPSVFVDVSAVIDRKIDAFLCYSAEVVEYPHPRSDKALRARAQFWGNRVNRDMAEAFTVVRSLR